MNVLRAEFKPGGKVLCSGIYRVVHGTDHTAPHEVICIFDRTFPSCQHCDEPRFTLREAAMHIEAHANFRAQPVGIRADSAPPRSPPPVALTTFRKAGTRHELK